MFEGKIVSEYDLLLKIILVGDRGVGKRTLCASSSEGVFDDDYRATVGVDFSIKLMKIGEYQLKLQLWDMGGQERFSYTRPLYFKGAIAGLMIFDVTNRTSFESITKYFNEIVDSVGKIPVYLVGNKADLPNRVVSNSEGWSLAKRLNILFIETSAVTGQKVQEMFEKIGEMAIMFYGMNVPVK